KSAALLRPAHCRHFRTSLNATSKFGGIGFKVCDNIIFWCKRIRMNIEFHIWEAIVPGRPIGYQRVPTTGPPALGNTLTFDNNVRDVFSCKMLAHRNAGLTTADNNNLNILLCHDYASEIFVRSITSILQKYWSIC